MPTLIKIVLPFFVISCFSFNIVFADEALEDYKKLDRELTKFVSALEERSNYLQKEIKYREHQLTGFRRFFYPREFGIREMVELLIKDDKDRLVKTNKLLAKFKEKRKVVQNKIVDIETGNMGTGKEESAIFSDSFDSYGKKWDIRGLLKKTEKASYTWDIKKGSIDVDPSCGKDSSGVDLDGTYGSKRSEAIGGKMVSRAIKIEQGTYLLRFDIKGNPIQKDALNTARYGIEGVKEDSITLGSKDGWREIKMEFSSRGGTIRVFFEHDGSGDWDGLYLDNVKVLKK